MSRDEKETIKKTGASPLWAVRIFLIVSDEVAGNASPPQ
jgi:hypothetical protein